MMAITEKEEPWEDLRRKIEKILGLPPGSTKPKEERKEL